jgi:hypothetical protein
LAGLDPTVAACLPVSLEGEVNLWHIRQWKQFGWLQGRRRDVDLTNGHHALDRGTTNGKPGARPPAPLASS